MNPLFRLPDQFRLVDRYTMILLVVILAILGITFAVGKYLQTLPDSSIDKGFVKTLNNRVQAWWMMYGMMGFTLFLEWRWLAVLFFFGISFWALREFITLTPTRLGDHRALFWVFFIFAPLQYWLVWLGQREYLVMNLRVDAGQLFTNLIPVYALLFVPARIALAGDPKRFLERSAKIQMGLYLCIYALSHAPALLDLKLRANNNELWTGGSAGVLLFLLLVVQLNDVFQFSWDKLLGKTIIAPGINAIKTWEGFAGGTLGSALVGMGLWWVTPFSPLQASAMALMLAVMGFLGSMAMSAIKRDRGVHDYGMLVEGHAGVLDRFDSICFAAPVFFHVTRFFFT